MAKITRKYQRIFCGDVPANNVVAEFGSLKAGLPTYSDDPDVIQSLSAWGAGWSGATVNNSAPALQDMNALFYVLSRQMAYLMQEGIAEYNATTIYWVGSLAYDGLGNIYKCLVDNTSGVAFSDTTTWVLYKSDKVTSTAINYSAAYSDYMIRATGALAITVTLPQATVQNKGRKLFVKSALTGGALLTVDAAGGSLIDGAASWSLSALSCLEVMSNGTSWDII